MKDLTLNLKSIYFHQIKDGEKPKEYRLCNDYWKKRLEGKRYRNIIIKLGYPKSTQMDRILVRPYIGWEKETITHEHFGAKPVQVYAIDVSGDAAFEL